MNWPAQQGQPHARWSDTPCRLRWAKSGINLSAWWSMPLSHNLELRVHMVRQGANLSAGANPAALTIVLRLDQLSGWRRLTHGRNVQEGTARKGVLVTADDPCPIAPTEGTAGKDRHNLAVVERRVSLKAVANAHRKPGHSLANPVEMRRKQVAAHNGELKKTSCVLRPFTLSAWRKLREERITASHVIRRTGKTLKVAGIRVRTSRYSHLSIHVGSNPAALTPLPMQPQNERRVHADERAAGSVVVSDNIHPHVASGSVVECSDWVVRKGVLGLASLGDSVGRSLPTSVVFPVRLLRIGCFAVGRGHSIYGYD